MHGISFGKTLRKIFDFPFFWMFKKSCFSQRSCDTCWTLSSKLFQWITNYQQNYCRDLVPVHLIILRKLMTKIFSFCLSRELKLVLAATSAKANGPTSGEYPAILCKFFQASKVRISLPYTCFKSIGWNPKYVHSIFWLVPVYYS